MNTYNFLKKILIAFLLISLWINTHAAKPGFDLYVNFDNATSGLGNMTTPTNLGFSVQCISNSDGVAALINPSCGSFQLTLSSKNNYRLVHSIEYEHSLAYLAIIAPGLLSNDGKTYLSHIQVKPEYFPRLQRAGLYNDILTLNIISN